MRWLLVPLALCAVSPAAFARDPSLPGFYMGGAIGEATVEFEDDRTGGEFDADDTGYKIIVGYRIIDWVSVEVNYSDYGDPVDRVARVNLESSLKGISVSALGLLPLRQFDLFARAGISRLRSEFRVVGFDGRDTESSTEPMFGFGAQFRPIPNVAIRAEVEGVHVDANNNDDVWDFFDTDERDEGDWVTMVSLGATYKF